MPDLNDNLKALKATDPLQILLMECMGGQNAEGAYTVGTRIFKTNAQPEDVSQNGQPGRVIGSYKLPNHRIDELCKTVITYYYTVEWDHLPGYEVMTTNTRTTDIPPEGYNESDKYEF